MDSLAYIAETDKPFDLLLGDTSTDDRRAIANNFMAPVLTIAREERFKSCAIRNHRGDPSNYRKTVRRHVIMLYFVVEDY